eukprot:TRINITY_DN3378_c0_g1_i1.p1 TRINITY_DN3378_c0_g1~~TRINITY_DN3378_c0_g1_i1.p1  ORF type:complete len:324 (+),score=37.36 TRINITY_DN3378_c0_g1_i1:2-973(+)
MTISSPAIRPQLFLMEGEDLTIQAIHPARKREISPEQNKLLELQPHHEEGRKEIVKRSVEGVNGKAFVLENVLSQKECEYLIKTCEEIGYTFWDQRPNARKDFRDADTIECTNQFLADLLWSRMKKYCVGVEELNEDHQFYQTDLQGNWNSCGINPNMLFGRYKESGHFAPHTDGITTLDFNHRSLYTVILYLNTCEKGGSTHIYGDEQLHNLSLDPVKHIYVGELKYRVDSVRAIQGSALVFYHALVHEGEPVEKGSEKYFIRTDVMYKRDPPICTAPEDVEAFRLYELAKEMTNSGEVDEAMKLFKKAFKMSPAIADIFQM